MSVFPRSKKSQRASCIPDLYQPLLTPRARSLVEIDRFAAKVEHAFVEILPDAQGTAERETRPLRDNRFAIISALVGRYSLTFSSSRKTSAGVGVSEIPDGHRWDSSPKIRFAPDSTLVRTRL